MSLARDPDTTDPPNTRPGLTYISGLVRGLVILYGMPTLGLILAKVLSPGPVMGTLLVLCLPVIFLMKERSGAGLVLSFSGLCLAGLTVFSLSYSRRLLDAPRLQNATTAEAVKAPDDVYVFRFQNVKVQSELKTEYRYRTQGKNSTTRYLYVAPVTEPDWSLDQPVRVWVVSRTYSGTYDWKNHWNSGLRLEPGRHSNNAVEKAQSQHGLISTENPLFLDWADPDRAYDEKINALRAGLIFPAPIWLFLWSVLWVGSRLKARKQS